MPHSRLSAHDGDGHTPVEALGELFISSSLWGWDCCAGVDCLLCARLENIQLVDHAAERAFHFVLLVSLWSLSEIRSSADVLVEYRIILSPAVDLNKQNGKAEDFKIS